MDRARSFLKVGILHWRGAAGAEDFLEGLFRGGLLRGGAGDEKEPVVAVVEMEDHFPLGPKDLGHLRAFDAAVAGLAITDVSEEGITFLAAVGIFKVVAEFEGVVEVEADRLDDEFGQVVERTGAADCEFGGKIAMLDFEVVFLHELGTAVALEGYGGEVKSGVGE